MKKAQVMILPSCSFVPVICIVYCMNFFLREGFVGMTENAGHETNGRNCRT